MGERWVSVLAGVNAAAAGDGARLKRLKFTVEKWGGKNEGSHQPMHL